ncbi:MAG TPA: methyltransferase domain-containing protein [Polyangiaceae bacterium]|jgi:ubiquinone/menaquinone biosynthesis C-methylase UbiE
MSLSMPTENTRAVSRLFRVWSRFYDNALPQQLFYRRAHRRIVRRWQPQPGQKVLDVGCGTGVFLKTLAADHPDLDLTGLDLSEPMLVQARRGVVAGRSPAPVFVQGSVYEMPFEAGTFDVALNTISCHFYLEQVRAFREMGRVLRPGGRLFCAALTYGLRGRGASVSNVARYESVAKLSEHFGEAGFEVSGVERMIPAVALFELTKR